jgi:hypothetical protein
VADLDVLNYALTLEHLEAAMYRQAIASGKLAGAALAYAQTFGAEEQAHADALTATIQKLGATPVRARASYNFPAFDTQENILAFLSKIEDTGVGAYLGQVGAIQSGEILGAAAGIYAVEALHTAAIRTMLGREANPNGAFEKPLTMDQVLAAAGPLLGPEAGAAPAPAPAPAAPAAAPAPAPQMPTQLPRTGGVDAATIAVVGAGLAAAGKLIRDRVGAGDGDRAA